MKKSWKAVGGMVLLILFIIILCSAVHGVMPDLENTIQSVDITTDKTFLTAENGAVLNVVYEIDAQGNIINEYQKLNHFWSRKEEIIDISYSDSGENSVYLLCRQKLPKNRTKYRVYRLNSEWKKAENIGAITKKNTFEAKDFNVAEDTVYFTGVDTAEDKLLVYTPKEEETGKMELLMERGATLDGESDQNIRWVNASFSGKSLYALSNRGQLFEYNEENETPFCLSEIGQVTWLCGNHEDIIYYDGMEDAFTSVESTAFLDNIEGQQGVVAVNYAKKTGDSISVIRNEEGNKEVTLYLESGEYYITRLFSGTFSCLVKICLVTVLLVGIFLCLLFFLALVWHLLQKHVKRPVLTAGIILENLLVIAVVGSLIAPIVIQQWTKTNGISASTYLAEEQMKCSQLLAEYTDIIPEEFPQSQWFEPMKALLTDWSVQEEDKGIAYQVELVEYEGEDSYILYSGKNPYGRNIYGIYEKELLEQLEQIQSGDGKGIVCVKNKNQYMVYAVEFLEENDNNCLLWVAKMQITVQNHFWKKNS